MTVLPGRSGAASGGRESAPVLSFPQRHSANADLQAIIDRSTAHLDGMRANERAYEREREILTGPDTPEKQAVLAASRERRRQSEMDYRQREKMEKRRRQGTRIAGWVGFAATLGVAATLGALRGTYPSGESPLPLDVALAAYPVLAIPATAFSASAAATSRYNSDSAFAGVAGLLFGLPLAAAVEGIAYAISATLPR